MTETRAAGSPATPAGSSATPAGTPPIPAASPATPAGTPATPAASPATRAGAPDEALDITALVAELQAEVERKRASGDYPAALLARLRTEFRPEEETDTPETLTLIESAKPLRSARPVVGGVIVFGKRVVRRLLAWYVAPIAVDQTRFNQAILRELRSLERRIEKLEKPSDPNDPTQSPDPR